MKLTKFIRFALTPSLFDHVRQEAKQRNISVSELIRRALWRYLSEERQRRRILGVHADHPRSLLATPLVNWTPEEERFANEVIQRHFDEDR
jgi:Ribbon-helix-helix protein, copG family